MSDAENEIKSAKREYARQYREKNREKLRAYNKAWREANPDKVKANTERFFKRKALKMLAEEDGGECNVKTKTA